jgi:hypothetical protein
VDVAENDSANRKEPAMNKSSKIRTRTAALLATTGAVAAFTLTGAASPASASPVQTDNPTEVAVDAVDSQTAGADEATETPPAEQTEVAFADAVDEDAELDYDGAAPTPEELSAFNAETDKEAAALQAAGIVIEVTTDEAGMRWIDFSNIDDAGLDKVDAVLQKLVGPSLTAEELNEFNAQTDKEAAALQAAGVPMKVTVDAEGLRWNEFTSTDESVIAKADKVYSDLADAEIAADGK